MVNRNLQQGAKCDGTYQRQVDLCDLEMTLVYTVSSKPAKATYLDAISKQTTKTNLQNERSLNGTEITSVLEKEVTAQSVCVSLTGKNGEIFKKMLLICLIMKILKLYK